MKEESVLNVLMYLFKNHMQDSCELNLGETKLMLQLEEMGFRRKVIDQAFAWLNNLSSATTTIIQSPNTQSLRVFSDHECEFFNMECRSFIMSLEQQQILNPHTRELVINQALELESEIIDVGLLKWVTLMVLFNQPDEKHALSCMELLVLDDTFGSIH